MSDMTMRLTLNEDVSSKMKKIVSEAKNVSKEMKTVGEAVDEAFSTSMADDFSDSIGDALGDVESDFTKLGRIIDNAFGGIGNSINEQTGAFAKSIDESTGKLQKALQDLDRSGNGLGGIGDDADGASRSLSGLNSNADTLGSTLNRLFTIAAGAVAFDRLKDFGLGTLEESAAATARESQFAQVFAGLEENASYSLGAIADETGILENRLKDSYISIAAFAKTTGMETADSMELSNRAMEAVADSAAFYDRSLEETTEALQSYLKGNYENDAFLGLASTEYTRNAEAMELYGKEFQDLSEEQKQWTLLSMVEEANELSGALGQAAREADTWTNQTGNLAQAWEDTKASLGDEIIDQSIGAVKSLTDNMDEIEAPLSRIFSLLGDGLETIVPMIPGGLELIADGLETVGSALGMAYDFVGENPRAIGTALTSIASGMVAMKAANSASNVAKMLSGTGGLAGALSSLSTTIFGSPWAAGAAAVGAAVGGIAMAVDQYNDLQISNNLDEHFGTISLDAGQAQDLAGQILGVDYIADMQLAGVNFDESENLVSTAEDLLNSMDYLHWKANVVADLSDSEKSLLISNQSEFTQSVTDALEKETYSATLSVKALLGETNAAPLVAEMESWFQTDKANLEQLSSAITGIMESALNQGVYDVNAQTAVSILQQKMMGIVSAQHEAEQAAELDWLELTSSGAALDAESWADVVNYMDEYRTESEAEYEDIYKDVLEYFNLAKANDHIDDATFEGIKGVLGQALDNQDATWLTESFGWLSDSINEAYGEELSSAYTEIGKTSAEAVDSLNQAIEGAGQGIVGPESVVTQMENAWAQIDSGLSSDTQGALKDRFETMLPTANEMSGIIDEYLEANKAVPQTLMDAYEEMMDIGAAAGDSDALYAQLAEQIVDTQGYDNFMAQIDELGIAIPEQFQTALERAGADVTELDYSGLWDGLSEAVTAEGDIDVAKVQEWLSQYGYSIAEYLDGMEIEGEPKVKVSDFDISEAAAELAGLSTTGNVITLPGGELAVEYKVTVGQTLSEIASNAGMALDELLAANPEITNPDVITVGQVVNIPADRVTVDTTGVGEAIEEQAQSQIGNVEMEGTATTTITESETDSSAAYSAASDDLDNTFAEQMDTQGYAGTEIQKQSDNINEVYNQTSTELQNAFNVPMLITARASITVDYSIANPVKTITFTGDATGSGTVYAHAAGGIFDEPHYGLVAEAGPEAIIPLDGSDNAFSLWQEAGERLGAFGNLEGGDLQGAAFAPPEEANMRTEYVRNDSRDINISINGNGVISARGGMSREEVANYITENIRDIILEIVEDEELGEGDGTYDW